MGADHHQEITFGKLYLPPKFFDEREQFSQEVTHPINSQSCTQKHAKYGNIKVKANSKKRPWPL
ncbi:unnamed protein product [Acanthoscelides obtectus]|uniref:Uncharacterized protein n=1 Tax=Acanthoscelides obtectus TaxID=200917 RepID=A0A9P0KK26_ACAOB|nr:unnamed protein product [Acanthoscelides obtectus]CAK1654540.1 hypothetical protein AOBTE_LOCUS18663 [Acanthoscelides obtectus]